MGDGRSQACATPGGARGAWNAAPGGEHRQAFSLDATRREPLLRLAALHCRLCEFEAAEQFARESLAIPHTSPYPEIESNYTWTPHSILYWSLFWLGRRDEARAHWEICLDLAPQESQAEEHARFFPPSTTV